MHNKKYYSFDIETTGFLKHEGDAVFAYVITDWFGKSEVYRIDGNERKANEKILRDFLNDPNNAYIAHNAKFEMSFLRATGFDFPLDQEWHDTFILSKMDYNIRKTHKLEDLAQVIYGYPKEIDKIVHDEARKHATRIKKERPNKRIGLSGFHLVDHDKMNKYQIADGERAMLLYQYFMPRVFNNRLLYADYLNEMEVIKTSVRMEEKGMLLDYKQHSTLLNSLQRKLRLTKRSLKDELGYDLNCNSPKQVVDLVINKLGVVPQTYTAKTNQPQVNSDLLERERDKKESPIFDLILRERAYTKGVAMLSSYKEFAHPKTGIIHPNLKTNEAKTGRQSCSDPNLQNISKEVSINSVYGIPARRCFRAEPGEVWFLIDYAGIELRLIVDACEEWEYIDAIKNGIDVHGLTSSALYLDKWDEIGLLATSPNGVKIPKWIDRIDMNQYKDSFKAVQKMMRAGAKNFVFGKAYGGKFAVITNDLLGLNDNEKLKGVSMFEKTYPKLSHFTQDTIKEVKANGYVTTAFGRKLYIQPRKEYTGSNYKIQGTAGGVLKRGQVRVDAYSTSELNDAIRLNVTVHDENILSYPRSLWHKKKEILPVVCELMTKHPEIKVPLEVEASLTSTNWANAKDYIL